MLARGVVQKRPHGGQLGPCVSAHASSLLSSTVSLVVSRVVRPLILSFLFYPIPLPLSSLLALQRDVVALFVVHLLAIAVVRRAVRLGLFALFCAVLIVLRLCFLSICLLVGVVVRLHILSAFLSFSLLLLPFLFSVSGAVASASGPRRSERCRSLQLLPLRSVVRRSALLLLLSISSTYTADRAFTFARSRVFRCLPRSHRGRHDRRLSALHLVAVGRVSRLLGLDLLSMAARLATLAAFSIWDPEPSRARKPR